MADKAVSVAEVDIEGKIASALTQYGTPAMGVNRDRAEWDAITISDGGYVCLSDADVNRIAEAVARKLGHAL